MIVACLYHIKSTNGLFYYAIDYLKGNEDIISVILVHPLLEHKLRDKLPGIKIISCSRIRFLYEVVCAHLRHDFLYTPTSHPLPFFNRQWIVLHDSYPFEVGASSNIKRFLLKWSLAFSHCRVGYINRSEAQPFIESLGVDPQRMVFAPNRFPEPMRRITSDRSTGTVRTVGLLGTDSAKKNYDRLFLAVRAAMLSSRLMFRVYGHDTNYFRDIREEFPDIQITLVMSDEASIDEFMSSVDVLASASDQEGFGRPIASALLVGLPVELLDRPVFREFFTGGARFHSDLDALVRSLPQALDRNMLDTPYIPPAEVIDAYVKANATIRRLGSNSIM